MHSTIAVSKVWVYSVHLRTYGGIFATIHVGASDEAEAKLIGYSWAETNHPDVRTVRVDAKRLKFDGEFRQIYIREGFSI